jgi:hypothetical protein
MSLTSSSIIADPFPFPLLNASDRAPPDRVRYGDQEWLLTIHPENRHRNSKVSPAWDHGQEYRLLNNPERKLWRCANCKSCITLSDGSISAAVRHLKKKHKILLRDEEVSVTGSVTGSVAGSERGEVARGLLQEIKVSDWRYWLLKWVIESHTPYRVIESEAFQQMLLSISQLIRPFLVQSGRTLANWALEDFIKARVQIVQLLASAKSRIHVSFDLWTSPNNYALCGVVAHFAGQDARNHSVLVGLKRMKGAHSGENIAEVAIPVLQEYGITAKLGVFVADNAESNDVAIRHILAVLRPDIKDPNSRRSRCLGHIINLAAKAFLFGKDVEAFEQITNTVDDTTSMDSEAMKKAQLAWRSKGAIGRLHNVAVFIRANPQRREAFKLILSGDMKIDGEWEFPL